MRHDNNFFHLESPNYFSSQTIVKPIANLLFIFKKLKVNAIEVIKKCQRLFM